MRDILVMGIVLAAALVALRRPWIGMLLWCWVSLMNPHRYTYGFAYDAPVAAIAAISVLLGMLMTADKRSPMQGAAVSFFVAFTLWMTLSWLFGFDSGGDYTHWIKVIKVNLMVLVALMLMHTKERMLAMTWVCALSLALLGSKGGLFTFMTGGGNRVWGPPGTFIEDNNEFALALVMTIPLLRFLQMQLAPGWGRRAMTALMVLCAAAALGSHSRGGFLALAAMTLVLWWRGAQRFRGGIMLIAIGAMLLAFMPSEWTQRMESIDNYEEDRSAMGRFSAWWVAWRVALHHPFGVGFNLARPELFASFSPYPDLGTPVAHSIYFQVLGNHGFVGLFLFLGVWAATWQTAGWLRQHAPQHPESRWCADLGAMVQVALIGYLVGGAFLNLAYFDLPYYMMALVILARSWVRREGWRREPLQTLRWSVPGLHAINVNPRPVSASDGGMQPGTR